MKKIKFLSLLVLTLAFSVNATDRQSPLTLISSEVFGKIQINNNSVFNLIITPADSLSNYGTFILSDPITIGPGKSKTIKYQLDWGVNTSLDSSASAKCEVHLDTELGFEMYWLKVGGKITGKFNSKAACEASLKLAMLNYTGILSAASVKAKFFYQEVRDVYPRASFKTGIITVNPLTSSFAKVEITRPTSFQFGHCLGYVMEKHNKETIKNYKIEPSYRFPPKSIFESANLQCR